MCQIVGIAHGDHGIVKKDVVFIGADGDACGFDITMGIIKIAQHKYAKKKVAQEF